MVVENRRRSFYTKKSLRGNRVKKCIHFPNGGGKGFRWFGYYEEDGSKFYRCQQCLYDLMGFVPFKARVMRKRRSCDICKITKTVIGFKISIPYPNGQKAFVCPMCICRKGQVIIND